MESGLNRNCNEQYYTSREVAKSLIGKIPDISRFDKIIEPSAGTGAFLDYLPDNTISYDIDPRRSNTIKKDFLTVNEGPEGLGKILVVGNPPFGRQSSLAKKFIKHSSTFADTIAFILPRSFLKDSMTKCFPSNFHLILSEELPKNSFIFNEKPYDVNCIFQIWTKKSFNRPNIKKQVNNEQYYFTSKEKCNLAFRRVGGKAGTFYIENLINLSEQSNIFIKVECELLSKETKDKLNEIEWKTKDFTIGAKSVSKQELIKKLNLIFINK